MTLLYRAGSSPSTLSQFGVLPVTSAEENPSFKYLHLFIDSSLQLLMLIKKCLKLSTKCST